MKEMRHENVKPNEVTFIVLIDVYRRAGLADHAEAAFGEMVAQGFAANVPTYNALMDAYGKSGRYQDMARTFEEMQLAGCRPDLLTYSVMLTACARCRRWEEALLVLYCLQKSGSEWELAICQLILGGPEEDTSWDNAVRMLESMQVRKLKGESRQRLLEGSPLGVSEYVSYLKEKLLVTRRLLVRHFAGPLMANANLVLRCTHGCTLEFWVAWPRGRTPAAGPIFRRICQGCASALSPRDTRAVEGGPA